MPTFAEIVAEGFKVKSVPPADAAASASPAPADAVPPASSAPVIKRRRRPTSGYVRMSDNVSPTRRAALDAIDEGRAHVQRVPSVQRTTGVTRVAERWLVDGVSVDVGMGQALEWAYKKGYVRFDDVPGALGLVLVAFLSESGRDVLAAVTVCPACQGTGRLHP